VQEIEGKIETPYRSYEVFLKKITPFHVYWKILEVTSWQTIAHHPTCSRYKNHLFKIGKIYLCVGCTSVYSTLSIFLILFFIYKAFFLQHFIILPLLFLYGTTTAVLQSLTKPKNKWVKALLRSNLGLGLGAYLAIIFLTPSWWIMVLLIFLAGVGVYVYNLTRKGANMALCQTCPLRYADPPCNPFLSTSIKLDKLRKMLEENTNSFKKHEF